MLSVYRNFRQNGTGQNCDSWVNSVRKMRTVKKQVLFFVQNIHSVSGEPEEETSGIPCLTPGMPLERYGYVRDRSSIFWHSSGYVIPTAAASLGSRLPGVMPGKVLISRHQTRPSPSRIKSVRE